MNFRMAPTVGPVAHTNIFQAIAPSNSRPRNLPKGFHRAPHDWVSLVAMERHREIARFCAETMEVGQELYLGALHEVYRRRFGIRTKNPYWYTGYLILGAVRDRRRWWADQDGKVHRSKVNDWQVFEIVSTRPKVQWLTGARTTKVRYVGPDPDIYTPCPPTHLLKGRDFR